jgi:hypothetical protein
MDHSSIERRIGSLENKTRRLRHLCWIQTSILVVIGLSAILSRSVSAQDSPRVLRAHGLVIEDDQGHARLILGAPLPEVHERKRQGSLTNSIVFLDEQGNDRLTLGEGPNPQAQGKILHRIATFFGVLIHDNKGNERGGYGWLSNGRAVVTLDRPGLDAWAAVVDDKTGFAGMRVEYAPDIANDKTGVEIGTQGSHARFRFMDTKERDRAVLLLGDNGVPSFRVSDETGRSTRDLLQSESVK